MFRALQADLAVAQGNLALACEASSEAVRLVDAIPDVIAVVRASILLSRARITSADRQWTVSDSLLRHAAGALRALPRGLPIVSVNLQRGFTLIHLRRLAEADSALTRAEQAYATTPMTIRGFATQMHILRAYLHDRAGDSTTFVRELAQVPGTSMAYALSFLAAQRTSDARDIAPADERRRVRVRR